MNKRLKLQCWNCPKTYFQTLDITKQKAIVNCPYCKAESVVDLRPYGSNTENVLRREDSRTSNNENSEEPRFPDILPTRKPE